MEFLEYERDGTVVLVREANCLATLLLRDIEGRELKYESLEFVLDILTYGAKPFWAAESKVFW